MKKTLNILAFLITVLVVSLGACLSANAEVQTGSCGDNVSYTLDTQTGELVISGQGKMKDYPNYGLTYYYSPFYSDSSIKSVDIKNGVTSIGNGAFSNCSSLESITIPDSVTNIGDAAFKNCNNLTYLYYNGSVEDWLNISASYGDSPNYYATNIYFNGKLVTDIVIPDTVTTIRDFAFENFKDLKSATIPDSVKSIGNSAFKNCTTLKSITIPDSVTSIDNSAFSYCTSLESITIPDSVTSIGNNVFSSCYDLKSITIPNSVTSIGNSAFDGCYRLNDVLYYTGSKTEWNQITIGDNYWLKNATIHYNFVPCAEGQHNAFGEWEVIKEATCTEDGLKQRTCNADGYVDTASIPALGHSYTQTEIAPTCTENGYAIYECSVCGDTYSEMGEPATGHTEKLINQKSATCSSTGYTGDKVCSVCNTVIEIGKEIPKVEHTYTSTTVSPTCTEAGYIIHKCVNCGYSYEEIGEPALGHKEIVDNAVEPTCTKSGLTEGSHCAVCKQIIVEQEVIDAKGHTAEIIKGTPATCTEIGLTDGKKCSICGGILEAQKEIPAMGHTVVVVNIKEATCTENGYSGDKVCSVCHNVFETGHKIDKLGHDFSGNAEYCNHGCGTKNSNYVAPSTSVPEPSTEPTLTTSAPTTTPATNTATQPQPNTSAPTTVAPAQTESTTLAPTTTTQVEQTATAPQTTEPNVVDTTQSTIKVATKPETKTTKAKETVDKKQKKASVKKATPAKASLTITWAKVKGVKGYEIQLATDKKFKKNLKKVTIKKQKTTKTTVKKLKAKKTYYVRIRTYKTKKVNGKSTKVYSSWSKVKTVKTK